MSRSLTFNSIDLSAYGLTVSRISFPMSHSTEPVQLQDKAVAYDSFKLPMTISAEVTVEASTTALLRSGLDSIRMKLNYQTDKELRFDYITGRYWNARFESMNGSFISPVAWRGDLVFVCLDPIAYSTTLTTVGPTAVNADPKTIAVTTGGTANISPVYSLIAGEDLTTVTITLENDETGDTLTWIGTILTGETLEIDVANWVVKCAGTEFMLDVSGKFPELLPDQANSLIITGFSTTGTLTVVYRNRYV